MVLKQIGPVRTVASGEMEGFHVGGKDVLVANIDGRHHACGGRCTHDGGRLADGQLLDGIVTCPGCGSRFDVTNGILKSRPATEHLPSYRVLVRDATVLVDV